MGDFGTYLKNLRKSKKVTLVELSRMVGVSQGYLSNIETGVRGIPSPELLRKVSKALGTTHIGMMIKAGYLTEKEVLIFREESGINRH